MNAYQVSICVGITRFFMSLLNAWFLKRFKRRPLVMVSGIGMAICMFVSGTFTKWIRDGKTAEICFYLLNTQIILCLLIAINNNV